MGYFTLYIEGLMREWDTGDGQGWQEQGNGRAQLDLQQQESKRLDMRSNAENVKR